MPPGWNPFIAKATVLDGVVAIPAFTEPPLLDSTAMTLGHAERTPSHLECPMSPCRVETASMALLPTEQTATRIEVLVLALSVASLPPINAMAMVANQQIRVPLVTQLTADVAFPPQILTELMEDREPRGRITKVAPPGHQTIAHRTPV
jgi:hypothetical protein